MRNNIIQNYLLRIEKIKRKLAILQREEFAASSSGTHYKVFLSKKYAIRFCDDNTELLLREASFLQKLNYPLIPKVLWTGKVDGLTAMAENRLPGETINLVWKTLSETSKINIIKQVVEFLQYLRTQTKDYVYSVKTGKKYKKFLDYLADEVDKKIAKIRKLKQANRLLEDLLSVINKFKTEAFFIDDKITLVHGDLIIHNLLTDGKNLTGILDWELALFGDPDYDLSRLFYYQEWAKAYQDKGIDETFEADYMSRLAAEILKSDLIRDKKLFQKKHYFIRAVFYLDALDWAVGSRNPQENTEELMELWGKKRIKYEIN